MPPEERDPSGFVTSPPSVVVRVTGTERSDLNGLLGIVVSFNVERERYLVHMTKSQSTMALRKENLSKASFVESYRAQWEQLKNDARVREKMSKYLNLCRLYVAPLKLSHVVGGVITIFLLLVYWFGVVKTVMTVSLMALIGIIAGPDLASGPQVVIQNFPERARTVIQKQLPILKGKLTNQMAVGVILFLVALCFQSLLVTSEQKSGRIDPSLLSAPPTRNVIDKKLLEQFYSMGYEDAAKGREHGATLIGELDAMKYMFEVERSPGNEIIKKRYSLLSKLTSVTNIISIFYLYRSIVDLGTDQSTGLFSVGQLAANIQHHTEWWRKALLVLSLYNICRVFL